MKKLGLLVLPILAITLMLGGNAFAQSDPIISLPIGDFSYYFVTYYSNANTTGAPDGTLRIINDGDLSGGCGGFPFDSEACAALKEFGPLWAAIYVFDDSQEMRSCCACAITTDGLLSESVNKQLTANEFTARGELSRGVIKIVSSDSPDPTDASLGVSGLRGWMTHVQATTNGIPTTPGGLDTSKGPWFVTEDALADSNLTLLELQNLEALCSYGLTIGSGYGNCPCTPEDYDF